MVFPGVASAYQLANLRAFSPRTSDLPVNVTASRKVGCHEHQPWAVVVP